MHLGTQQDVLWKTNQGGGLWGLERPVTGGRQVGC